MKINLKKLRETIDEILKGWVILTVGFFAVGGYFTGAVSFMFVLRDLEVGRESLNTFYNLLFGSARFLLGGLIILFGLQIVFWLWGKMKEQDKKRREELIEIIRENVRKEIKSKKRK